MPFFVLCLMSFSFSAIAFTSSRSVNVMSVSGTGLDIRQNGCALIGENRAFAGAVVLVKDGAAMTLGMDGTPDSTIFYNLSSSNPLHVGTSLSGENGKFEIQSIDASLLAPDIPKTHLARRLNV